MAARRAIVVILTLVAAGAAALVWLPIEDDTTIDNVIVIDRPPAAVFAYVTTPGNWPRWHALQAQLRLSVAEPVIAIINRFSMRSQVEQESDRAARNLKRILETLA